MILIFPIAFIVFIALIFLIALIVMLVFLDVLGIFVVRLSGRGGNRSQGHSHGSKHQSRGGHR
jgi:hypothetical protein